MRRAARFKTGSVVFDRRRKTWNYLWWEQGKRRSKLIGNLQQFPDKRNSAESSSVTPTICGDVCRTGGRDGESSGSALRSRTISDAT